MVSTAGNGCRQGWATGMTATETGNPQHPWAVVAMEPGGPAEALALRAGPPC